MSRDKYLMTQSLLAAWQYQYRAADTAGAHRDFLRVLRREAGETTQAMRDGIAFEDMVTAYIMGGKPPESHRWYNAVCQAGELVRGSQPQVKAYRETRIGRTDLLLYGRLDYLRAGTIFDTKFSRSYQPGKYVDSPQHPMYFACEPGAYRFVYLVSDGADVYTETYRREETQPVERVAAPFLSYLKAAGLMDTYYQYWRTKN